MQASTREAMVASTVTAGGAASAVVPTAAAATKANNARRPTALRATWRYLKKAKSMAGLYAIGRRHTETAPETEQH